jgi:hypothetical protein
VQIVAGDFSGSPDVGTDRQGPILAFRYVFRRAVIVRQTDIEAFEQVTDENKSSALRKTGWAVAGVSTLGAVGLLAGLIVGGRQHFIIAALKLRDGRRAILKCDQKGFEALCKVVYGDPNFRAKAHVSPLRGALIAVIVIGILWLFAHSAQAQSASMTCRGPNRDYVATFDAASRSFLTNAGVGATTYLVEQIEQPRWGFIVRGKTADGGREFAAYVGSPGRIEFYEGGEIQVDQCSLDTDVQQVLHEPPHPASPESAWSDRIHRAQKTWMDCVTEKAGMMLRLDSGSDQAIDYGLNMCLDVQDSVEKLYVLGMVATGAEAAEAALEAPLSIANARTAIRQELSAAILEKFGR